MNKNHRSMAARVAFATLMLSLLVSQRLLASSLEFFQNGANAFDYAQQTSLPSAFGSGEFTLELWLKPNQNFPVGSTTSTSSKYTTWSSADVAPYSRSDWWYYGNFLLDGFNNSSFPSGSVGLQFYGGGRLRWLFGDGSSVIGGVRSVGAYPASNTPSLLDGRWHHVTLVRRWSGSSASQLELWIDGALIDSETSPVRTNMRQWWNSWSGYPSGQSGFVWGAEKIAAISGAAWEDYKGLVDDVRFWSRAKSASEIQSNWSQPVYGTESGLVGWYQIGEMSGSRICDSITNACMSLYRTQSGTFDPEESPASSAPRGDVEFAVSSYSVAEDGGSVTVRVTRTGGSSGAASVNYATRNGSATAGADYQARTGTLTWANGQSGERTVQISIINDSYAESAETFSVDLSTAVGADMGSPATATVSIAANDQPNQGPSGPVTPSFSDTFARADGAVLGNSWIEKTANSFSLSGGAVQKNAPSGDFRNSLVYRPASEDSLDVESIVELRFQQFPVGYPAVLARAQASTVGLASRWDGYLVYLNNSQTQAVLGRQTGTGWDTALAVFSLSRSINLTDTYRLRLRAVGTNPVRLDAYVERFTGSAWEVLGEGHYSDSSSSRIATAGAVGFAGDDADRFRVDNFTSGAAN
ncbi:hypothetical protein HNQ60_004988 [Povalibacter uvarum]|uniref:Calx-beta domain-containing protein n=1 Tax=Povalibacter uvarum TaxID=732238 RepID=A0A841HS38_9GAMM|nr:Calx-beta domain-containing protein [Povalibacter uvarum]MBB6096097.1 hypothetical protein [Povalibacter uvarum]